MSDFNFIYAEEHLSHREKAVYIYLRDRADASGVCWPGIKTIARELGLSPRTVQRALADLERRQLIEKRNRRRSNGSLTSNLYRLTKHKTSQPPAKALGNRGVSLCGVTLGIPPLRYWNSNLRL